MKKEIEEYGKILESTLKIQNLLVKLHAERISLYDKFFFTKYFFRFKKINKETFTNSLSRINKTEKNYLTIIEDNKPTNKLFLNLKNHEKELMNNILSFYDIILEKQKSFILIERDWIDEKVETEKLLVSYNDLIDSLNDYSKLNEKTIKGFGNYLNTLKSFLDQKNNSSKLDSYPLFVLPFVGLFDVFLDQYFYWFKDVPITPIQNEDNLAVLIVALFLVYFDLPTKVGSIYSKFYFKLKNHLKNLGKTY
jgi:hypothetical protein